MDLGSIDVAVVESCVSVDEEEELEKRDKDVREREGPITKAVTDCDARYNIVTAIKFRRHGPILLLILVGLFMSVVFDAFVGDELGINDATIVDQFSLS